MKNIKALIYTIISTFFLVLTLKLISTDFDNTGFNKSILLSISALMTIATIAASLKMWMNRKTQKEPQDINFPIARWRKVLFASLGVALGTFWASVILGLWFLNPETVISFVNNYMLITILSLLLVALPFVNKYLK